MRQKRAWEASYLIVSHLLINPKIEDQNAFIYAGTNTEVKNIKHGLLTKVILLLVKKRKKTMIMCGFVLKGGSIPQEKKIHIMVYFFFFKYLFSRELI